MFSIINHLACMPHGCSGGGCHVNFNMDLIFSKHLDSNSIFKNDILSLQLHLGRSHLHSVDYPNWSWSLVKHENIYGLFKNTGLVLLFMLLLYFVGLLLIQCNLFVSMSSGGRKRWIWALKKQPLFNTYLVVIFSPRSNVLLLEDFSIFVYICCSFLYIHIID